MNKLMEKMQLFLDPILTTLNKFKLLLILSHGLSLVGSIVLIGSLFIIITQLPYQNWQRFISPALPQLRMLITLIFGHFSLFLAVCISVAATKINQLSSQSGISVGLLAFLLSNISSNQLLYSEAFGPKNLFGAIVIPIIAIESLLWFVNHNICFKNIGNLPPAVITSLTSIIPALIVLSAFYIIELVLPISLSVFIDYIFSPLAALCNSLVGIMIILFLTLFLWTLGIHGNNILGTLFSPFFLQSLLINGLEITHGKAAGNITADGFLNFGMNIGGTGAILALTICTFTAKSTRIKSLGKSGFLSSIFGISESIVFGLPVVMNPTMLIPFIGIPILLQSITYILMHNHIIGMVIAQVPWTTPTILNGYLITGGDWRAALWQLIELLIAILIYWPFLHSIDHKLFLKELSIHN